MWPFRSKDEQIDNEATSEGSSWLKTVSLGYLGNNSDDEDESTKPSVFSRLRSKFSRADDEVESDDERNWTQTLTLGLVGAASQREKERYSNIWADPEDDQTKRIRLIKLLDAYVGYPVINQLSLHHHLSAVAKIRDELNTNKDYSFKEAFIDLLKIYHLPEFNNEGTLAAMIEVMSTSIKMSWHNQAKEACARTRALEILKTYNQGFLHPNRHFSSEVEELITYADSDASMSAKTIHEKVITILRETNNPNGRLAKICGEIGQALHGIGIYSHERNIPTPQFKK